jgi:hypothetical protein
MRFCMHLLHPNRLIHWRVANIYRDIPRGRKRKGWKEEFLRTLKDAASDVGDLSEKRIIESVRSYRSASRLQPEVEVVS